MKIKGAIMTWEQGATTHFIEFDEVKKCMSLKDSPVKLQYKNKDYIFNPLEEHNIVTPMVKWLTGDNSSPFKNDASLYVHPDDSSIDIDAVKDRIGAKAKAAAVAESIPDGLPNEEWRPTHLMSLHRMMNPVTLPLGSFTVMKPAMKAKMLAEYMVKNGKVVSGGKLVENIRA